MTAAPRRLEATLRAFADRLFVTGGNDPGEAALALPPERLTLYRELCRGNYRGMLRFAFTQAFELMDREIAAAETSAGLPDGTPAIVARFLEVSPSRTHSSREIADRFLAFLPGAYPRLVARRPDLVDLMRLERAGFHAMFAPDDPGRCLGAAEVERLAAGSLDDLLAITVLVAPSASVLRLSHRVRELRETLERGGTPEAPRPGAEIVGVCRGAAPRFAIGFASLSGEAALVYDSADAGVPVTAERLATTWYGALAGPSADWTDERKAGEFASAVLGGLATGHLRAN